MKPGFYFLELDDVRILLDALSDRTRHEDAEALFKLKMGMYTHLAKWEKNKILQGWKERKDG